MKHEAEIYVEWSDAAKLQFFHALGLKDGDSITAPGLAVSQAIPLRRAREILHHALGCKLLQRVGPDRFVRWSEPDERWCNPQASIRAAKGKEYTATCRGCGKRFTALLISGNSKRKTCSQVCQNDVSSKAMKARRAQEIRDAEKAKKGKWWTI